MTNKVNHYTDEQVEWIINNYHLVSSYKELAKKFNLEFSTDRSSEQIREKCNKSLKLTGMPNLTKYGNKQKEELPLGTIRRSQTCTYIKIKMTNGNANITSYREPYWMPLQKKIYQDTYGEIKTDEMICFLDGNNQNFDINNLYCINRKISAIMSCHKWWTKSKEHTLTAIKLCELLLTLKTKE